MPKATVAPDRPPQSRFKVRDLLSLSNPQRAYLSPLAVIAHIDVNAFFAQVEQIRLGLSKDDPVVCVQWNTLIAVSYAAREYGISRMDSLDAAKLKCDKLIAAHTAAFKKGENFWRYRDDEKEHPSAVDHKVSLDPYRRESRKIMKIFKRECDLVEKASVDESFMDLGRLVLKRLDDLVPGIVQKVSEMDKQETLPPIPDDLTLETHGLIVATPDETDDKPYILDWDDVLILIGAQITHSIRQMIERELGYTTSCGVAKVKTVAKLASGFMKPDHQTIVRNNSIHPFLSNFDFTDFWSMGGKTGEYIRAKLSPPSADNIKYIRENYDLSELQEYLEDSQLAEKLYLMVRGQYAAPLSERITLKSMNSNKNIRGNAGASLKDASEWIRVFAADLVQRLAETDDENGYKTRPKTISIHFRSARDFNSPHSKQMQAPIVPFDELEETYYQCGVTLLKACETQFGKIYPLANISLTISNFEISDGLSTSIMGFVKKGTQSSAEKSLEDFKAKQEAEKALVGGTRKMKTPEVKDTLVEVRRYDDLGEGKFRCVRCGTEVEDTAEHDDFHYAIDITEQLNGADSLSSDLKKFSSKKLSYAESKMMQRSSSPSLASKRKASTPKGVVKGKKAKVEKGQSRLPF